MHIFDRATGKYLGPLVDRWSQGEGFPDVLVYPHAGQQIIGVQADHADLRGAAPAKGAR